MFTMIQGLFNNKIFNLTITNFTKIFNFLESKHGCINDKGHERKGNTYNFKVKP